MSANVGYARCSSVVQDLTAQRQQLAALGVPAERIYVDAYATPAYLWPPWPSRESAHG